MNTINQKFKNIVELFRINLNQINQLIDQFTIFLKKHIRLFLLSIIIIIVFHKYIVFLISFFLLGYLGIFTIKISKVVPHISIETVTPSSILIGYIWGWKAGLIFGILFGLLGFINSGQINLISIICILLMGLVGVTADIFATLGLAFWISYLLAYFIRANLSFFIISRVNSNVVENIMHSYVESGYNMIIIIHFMMIFHSIILNFI